MSQRPIIILICITQQQKDMIYNLLSIIRHVIEFDVRYIIISYTTIKTRFANTSTSHKPPQIGAARKQSIQVTKQATKI